MLKNGALILRIAPIVLLMSCATRYYSKTGTVTEITQGKDGYAASLRANDGTEYTAIMSILNLRGSYARLKPGDRVKVTGDTIHIQDRVTIKVKKFSLK